jgi:hypothetical protein
MKYSPFALFIFEHYISVTRFAERLNISRQTASWYIHLSPSKLNVKHLKIICSDTGEEVEYIYDLILQCDAQLIKQT